MPKEVIHIYRKFGVTIEFSIDEKGILLAQIADESQRQEIPFIRGLPAELRSGLLDEAKKAHVKRILEDSYFVAIGHEVQVNARLRGGWGDEVHKGYDPSTSASDGTPSDGGTTKNLGPSKYAIIEGTYGWARELGFPAGGDTQAIADACQEVDKATGGAAPYPEIGRPEYHFNLDDHSTCGSQDDTRIIYATTCLAEAIGIRNGTLVAGTGITWQKKLGFGLHALQDTFAHIDDAVTILASTDTLGRKIRTHWAPSTTELKSSAGFFLAATGISLRHPLYIALAAELTVKHTSINTKGEKADDAFADDLSHPSYSPASFVREPGEESTKQFNQRYSDTKTATYLYLAIFLCNTRYRDGTHAAEISNLCSRICGVGANLRIQLTGANRNAHRFHGLLARVAVIPGITIQPTIRALFFPPASSPSVVDAARSSMKTAPFGVSRHVHPTVRGEREVEHNSDGTIKRIGGCLCSPTTHGLLSRGLRYDVFRNWGWGSAGYDGCDGYMAVRANGTDEDSPGPFPHDGIYTWDTPDARESKIRYVPGPRDQAWMEERDQRYLSRLEREAVTAVVDVARRSMKTATFGISPTATPHYNGPDWIDGNRHPFAIAALRNYRENRENGSREDNPTWKFPEDGTYSWENRDQYQGEPSRVRYTPGRMDREWIDEHDRNYLARLEREAASGISRGPTM